jgi:DNA-directed RNA polymerase sigma subunit (sigma70/sigma32)
MAKTKKNKVSATALRAEIVEIANQLIKKYPRELRASKIIDAYLHTEIHSVEPERIIATLRKHHAKIVFDLPGVKNDDDLTNYLAISYTKNAHGYTDKQYGSHFQILNVFVNNSVLLSASDELKFLKQVHSKNPEQAKIARAELINANYRLVMSIAQHYCHHGIEIIDLFQEGVAGLGTAIEKFDYRSKNRLSTYATF